MLSEKILIDWRPNQKLHMLHLSKIINGIILDFENIVAFSILYGNKPQKTNVIQPQKECGLFPISHFNCVGIIFSVRAKKKAKFIKVLLSLVAQYEKEVEREWMWIVSFRWTAASICETCIRAPTGNKKASLQPSFHCSSAFNNSKIWEKKLIQGSCEIWLIIFFFN